MRKVGQFILAALAPFVALSTDLTADPAFDRYRSIIDRMPFGKPPPNFNPSAPPGSAEAAAAAAAGEGAMTEEQRTEEEQKLAAAVRVSVLNITPAGRTMVGFTDSSAKPPEHYYLPVGGERDGWKVKEADPATEKVTLAKGELEVTLKLGEGSVDGGKDPKKKGAARSPGQPMRRSGLVGARLTSGPAGAQPDDAANTPPGGEGALGAITRLRERRARMLQEQREEDARRAKAAAEEKAENERKAAEAKAAAEEAAAERAQQRAALLQIQEELRRQREEKQRAQEQSESTTEE